MIIHLQWLNPPPIQRGCLVQLTFVSRSLAIQRRHSPRTCNMYPTKQHTFGSVARFTNIIFIKIQMLWLYKNVVRQIFWYWKKCIALSRFAVDYWAQLGGHILILFGTTSWNWNGNGNYVSETDPCFTEVLAITFELWCNFQHAVRMSLQEKYIHQILHIHVSKQCCLCKK